MRKIGIIAAMEPEMDLLLDNLLDYECEKYCGMSFYSGVIGNNEIVLVQCGVGKVNASMAATILILNYEVELLINTGIAGGVGLNTKDVVIAEKLSYHDFDIRIFGYDFGQVPQMPKFLTPSMASIVMVKTILNKLNINYKCVPVYSGDQFVTSFDQLKNVDYSNPIAIEMEGAAIAHAATKAGVEFIVLRYISDCVGAENQVSDYHAFELEMAQRSANICLKLIEAIE